jgi:hypothetical protein
MLSIHSKTISMPHHHGDASALMAACADCVRTFRTLFDPYRPELYYMRGPGPKWHAKHDRPDRSTRPTACLTPRADSAAW